MHRGSCRALEDCTLMMVDASSFHEIAGQFTGHESFPMLTNYADQFVEAMNHDPESNSTDIGSVERTEECVRSAKLESTRAALKMTPMMNRPKTEASIPASRQSSMQSSDTELFHAVVSPASRMDS